MRPIYPNPGLPIYESMTNFVGGRAIPIQLHEEHGFRLDIAELAAKITDRTKLIILNSPANPTGAVLIEQDIRDVVASVGDRNIAVLSDEIYSRLIFEGTHCSPISIPEFRNRTILLDGFSKT
jgi:aspartate aminotransferase